MLDDLRNSASSDYTPQPEPIPPATPKPSAAVPPPTTQTSVEFLGMTAGQRFVIAMFLLLIACILGSFCLLVTGKVWLPFF
jgi:hypothetical protein